MTLLKKPEERLQGSAAAILDTFQYEGKLMWWHTPNESMTKAQVQWYNKRKLLGVKKGVPDIIILYPEKQVLFIELKYNTNKYKYPEENKKLTKEQLLWRANARKLGFDYVMLAAKDEYDLKKQLQKILKDHRII